MLPFVYTLEGAITDVLRGEARTWRQDPGRPLPPEVARITGLADPDLEGEAVDTAAAPELVAGAHLVGNSTHLPRRDVTARDRWRADPLELTP